MARQKKLLHFINIIYCPNDSAEVKGRNKDGSQSDIPYPPSVKKYNCFMGGVDLLDAKRKVYLCTRCSKKWCHGLFYFIVDTCIVNALIILHNENSHTTKINQKEFRLELARELLALYSSQKHRKRGRASLVCILQPSSKNSISLINLLSHNNVEFALKME